MKRKRFTEEQIIAVLKEAEAGMKTGDLARRHGIERFPHEPIRRGFPLRRRCDSYVDAPLARAICRDGFDRLLSYVRPVCAAFLLPLALMEIRRRGP